MSTDTASQTEVTLGHHLQSVIAKDIEAVLSDYTEDSVLISQDATFTGLAGMRTFFEGFLGSLTPELLAIFKLDKQEVNGELAYITWSAGSVIPLGTDTFIVQNGKIRYQTLAAYMGS